MLQLPSTGSIYAKAVKKCFVAPKGKLIFAVDLNALEDRVLASLTLDEGKCALLEDETIDGHCYNALGYYYDEASKYLDTSKSFVDQAREFKVLVEAKHSQLKEIRQKSKAVTFKLGYFGGVDSHKNGAITPEIYESYHTKLYPKVKAYVDNYVIPTTKAEGKIHLGLGFILNSDDPERNFRTTHNATCQFWSILTILTINKLHQLIDEQGLQSKVQIISSIYDSIYIDVDRDPVVVKWVNDTIIPLLTADFIPNQRIPNSAEAEIGTSWADLLPLPNNASLEEITTIINSIE
jgi:DNA polymerase-1